MIMNKKVSHLTEKQTARFPEFVERWTRIGLSTAPADRPRSEAAIGAMYAAAGLSPPRIVWCESPMLMLISHALLTHRNIGDGVYKAVTERVRASVIIPVFDRVGYRVWASVRNGIEGSIGDSIQENIREHILKAVWERVWSAVDASVRAGVLSGVESQVRDSVRGSVRRSIREHVLASVGDFTDIGECVRTNIWKCTYGQHDAPWLGFYNFFDEVVGLHEETAPLRHYAELAQSAGWALPCENVCFVSERHCAIHQDERGRLHCVDGPAVAYPDGWAVYAVHGVRVPGWVITEPSQITVAKIDAEENAEVRRVMLERYGLERFIQDSGATIIDHDERWGTLYRRDLPDDEPLLMVEVINSSPEPDGSFRQYMIRVAPTCRTALEAVASSFRMSPSTYAQIMAES